MQLRCLSCLLPVGSSRPFFLGKVAFDLVGLGDGPPCLRVDSEEILLTLTDERAQLARAAPGVTPVDCSEKGAPVRELIFPSVLGEPLADCLHEPMIWSSAERIFRRAERCLYMAEVWDWPVSVHYTSVRFGHLRGLLSLHCLESVPRTQSCHCQTTIVRVTPGICYSHHAGCIERYVIRSSIIVVVLIWYCSGVFRIRTMASDGLPDREQPGPSGAPSGPLPGTFLGPALDIRSEYLYELGPDIPDVMGLRALRPDTAAVKVMSVGGTISVSGLLARTTT